MKSMHRIGCTTDPRVTVQHCACVLQFKAGGLPEVIEHGKSGLLSDIGDIETMAENALDILSEEHLESYSKEAEKRAKEVFSIESIGPKYEELYQQTISKN